ncbi:MAG TPA: hypothetical protein PLZ43_00035, partial [bacterium]|nr:hypothetical protein [bacterium]
MGKLNTKPTDITEAGLESLIVKSLIEESKYVAGDPRDYDRTHAVDLVKLTDFIKSTQPDIVDSLS